MVASRCSARASTTWSPLSRVELYDLRAQERDEDLLGVTSDGVPVRPVLARDLFDAPDELVALEREVGRNYYDVVIRPLVRSTVRRVLAGYRADQLDTATIVEAQRQITQQAAARLRPFHIVLDSIDLRTLAVRCRAESYRTVLDVGVLEQELLGETTATGSGAANVATRCAQRARAIAARKRPRAPTLHAAGVGR